MWTEVNLRQLTIILLQTSEIEGGTMREMMMISCQWCLILSSLRRGIFLLVKSLTTISETWMNLSLAEDHQFFLIKGAPNLTVNRLQLKRKELKRHRPKNHRRMLKLRRALKFLRALRLRRALKLLKNQVPRFPRKKESLLIFHKMRRLWPMREEGNKKRKKTNYSNLT